MLHFYNSNLVLLSIAVAIVSSFSALNLSARLTVADSGARGWWTLAAALALGGGIWSTHFVGMLAMRMPANYDLTLTLGSGLIAVVACGASIQIICRFGTSLKFLAGSGMLLGLAMAGMHYSGMAGLQVRGMDISYDPALVIRSIVIAISAATAALWLTFHAKRLAYRIVGSGIMGMAIAGMHYTGMAAATFHRNDHLHQSLARLPVAPGMIAALIVAGISPCSPSALAIVPQPIDPKADALAADVVAPLKQVEQQQVATVAKVRKVAELRYAKAAAKVRSLGLAPERFDAAVPAMGGPYEAANGAEAAADIRADMQFRSLFMTWKKLDNLEQGTIAIPSVQPVERLAFTSNFGIRSDPFRGTAAFHAGVDIPGPLGTPVYATADGIVDRAERAGGYEHRLAAVISHGA
eukprot:gene37438-50526_t